MKCLPITRTRYEAIIVNPESLRRLDSGDTGVAVHLLVECADVLQAELSGQGEMEAVSVREGWVIPPAPQCLKNGILALEGDGWDTHDFLYGAVCVGFLLSEKGIVALAG